MTYKEINIPNKKYGIEASIKIPNKKSNMGIILAHGGIINRHSLIRNNYSFAEYLSKKLNSYVIAPDFNSEKKSKDKINYYNLQERSDIINITSRHFVETFNLETLMGFGHSMGSFVLSKSLNNNQLLDSIVNYGGPIKEIYATNRNGFLDYLVNYLSSFNYEVNIKNIMKYIFDRETMKYLENVMLKEKEYSSDNYNYVFDYNMFLDFKNAADVYIDNIVKWGKPTLLLFGSKDSVTKKTLNYYRKISNYQNIKFKSIIGASHVTPCMKSKNQLSKLQPVVNFYEKIYYLKARFKEKRLSQHI